MSLEIMNIREVLPISLSRIVNIDGFTISPTHMTGDVKLKRDLTSPNGYSVEFSTLGADFSFTGFILQKNQVFTAGVIPS